MRRLTLAETPKTKVEFVQKWNSDNVFRSRAQSMGISVIMGNVIFPNGTVAGPTVK